MQSDGSALPLLVSLMFGLAGAVVAWGPADLLAEIWNGWKAGMRLLIRSRPRRTAVQKRFKTDMKWHQVRWSIARLEHELMPPDEWTHDVADCVHPDCNITALVQIKINQKNPF